MAVSSSVPIERENAAIDMNWGDQYSNRKQ